MNSIDIETFGTDDLVPYCACFIYNNKKYGVYGVGCVKKLMVIMFNVVQTRTTFYAHNLTFDGALILQNLPNNCEIIKSSLKNGNLYMFSIHSNEILVSFKCSQKILPIKLSKIATLFNLPQKKVIKHDEITALNYKDKQLSREVIAYCFRDCEIVCLFLQKIDYMLALLLPNWQNMCLSLSGLSLKLFEKNFNTHNVLIKTDLALDNVIRGAYYGGRCEVFGNATKNESVYHYDFTGMYTQILTQNFPLSVPKINKKPKDILNVGFYRVVVNSENFDIPILPYRDLINKKLLFPNGVFSGLFWYEELQLFLDHGGKIIEFIESFEFDNVDTVFKTFADFCQNSRTIGDAENVFWKNIANSFTGRLGIKPENDKSLIIMKKDYNVLLYHDVIISETYVNDIVILKIKSFAAQKYIKNNVVYSAIITSKARVKWWLAAKKVGECGGRVLYCDTDSIFAAFDKSAPVLNKQMGDVYWDSTKVDTLISKSNFIGAKLYGVVYNNKDVVKIKGVTYNSITFDMLSKLVVTDDYLTTNVTSFIKKNLNISIKDVTKKILFSKYDKRLLNKDKTESVAVKLKDSYPTLYNGDTVKQN